MECSKSLLSQVLKGDLHLTPEHGCRLAHFLNFNEDEQTYLLLMISLARSGTKDLEQHYRRQMEELRAQQLGANAVVNIKSNYRNNLTSSTETFQCGAGTFVAGVALQGEVVTIGK